MAEGPPWAMADMARPPPPPDRPAPPPLVARDMVGILLLAEAAILMILVIIIIFLSDRIDRVRLLYKWRCSRDGHLFLLSYQLCTKGNARSSAVPVEVGIAWL